MRAYRTTYELRETKQHFEATRHFHIVLADRKILNATPTVMALQVQWRVQCELTQDAIEY